METTPANLVANRVYLKKDMPYTFNDRPWMVSVFDDDHRYKLLKTARQVSKSTTLAAEILVNTEIHAPYTVLYLSPTFKQTSTFSHDRLGPTIKDSPHIHMRMDADCLDNVLEKEFVDGSLIYLSYAKDNADRCRGLTADELDMDEIQDMNVDAVEHVVSQSLFTSRHKRRKYSGTPKSFANPIESLWRKSDQREWMVRCWRHGAKAFHQKLTRDNVGLKGQICSRCGNPLNTLDGLWVRTQTLTEDLKEPHIHGYHIPQILFPTLGTPLPGGSTGFLDWDQFLRDMEQADEATVLNEMFGESADSAEMPITEDQLKAMCTPGRAMATEYQADMNGSYTFAGVDWGAGIQSATAFVIGQFNPRTPNKFRLVFFRRFHKKDANPQYCVPEIMRLCQVFRVKRLHADWGSGLGQNSRILEEMGDDFITTNYWNTSIVGRNIAFDPNLNRFVLNRTVTMSRFFEALKRQGFEVAMDWNDFRSYAQDILNVRREERPNSGDPFYVHVDGKMDDFCHAIIYCWLIACWMKYSANFVDEARKSAREQSPIHNPALTW